MGEQIRYTRGRLAIAVKGKSRKKPKTNSVYMEMLDRITKHLTLAIQCGAISTLVGGLVMHYYLKTIGFEYLFIEIIGSQGGLIAILVAFFGFGFIGFLIMTLGPLIIWASKNYLLGTPLAKQVFSGSPICRLIVATHVAIVSAAFFPGINWLYAVFLLFPIAYLFFIPAARKLFREARNKQITWRKCAITYSIYYVVIMYSLGMCAMPWTLILSFIERLLAETAYKDNTIVGFGLAIVASFILGFISILIIDSSKLGERRKGLNIFSSIVVVLAALSIFVAQDPYVWVRGGLIGAGAIERPEVRRWYQIKKETFGELRVGDHARFVKSDEDGHHYMCANSPFSYVQTKVLCDPGVTKPNPQQCIVFTNKEARPVGFPLAGEWSCPDS